MAEPEWASFAGDAGSTFSKLASSGARGASPLPQLSLDLLDVSPVPSPGKQLLRLSLGTPQSVEIDLFDVAGRRVRSLFNGVLDAGTQVVEWDGRSDKSERVSAGVYWYRVRGEAGTRTMRTTVVR